MSIDVKADLIRQGLYLIFLLSMIIILPGMCVGLIVSLFQAVTQINEMSLTFVPKLLVTLGVLFVAGPWILDLLIEYTRHLIMEIPNVIG